MRKQVGIFLTDASYDHKTKVSNASILDIKESEKFEACGNFSSVVAAESNGIMEALKIGSARYDNILIFCDSKPAVNSTRKQVLSDPFWRNKFYSIQIVWVPRTETTLADFFSKNITNGDANFEKKKESFIQGCKLSNVMDLVLDKRTKLILLKKIADEVKEDESFLEDFDFKSERLLYLFRETQTIPQDSIEEISRIEEDVKSLFLFKPKFLNENEKIKTILEGILSL